MTPDPSAASRTQVSAASSAPRGLDAFREAKHAHIDTEIEVKDWWYPTGDPGRAAPAGSGSGAGGASAARRSGGAGRAEAPELPQVSKPKPSVSWCQYWPARIEAFLPAEIIASLSPEAIASAASFAMSTRCRPRSMIWATVV